MSESGVPDEPMRGRETLWSRFLVRSRARLERALRASERRFRVLSDSMPQLVWAARADATVDYYNARAREYGGLTKRPDGSWRWRPIVHPDDLERTMKAWYDAVACSGPYACEHRIRMADGTFRWHLSRAHLVREENGEARWYGTATDIDDQKRVEHALQVRERELAEALRTAEGAVRERDQLLSLVSHDLRNPLAGITMQLAILRRNVDAGNGLSAEELAATVSRLERYTSNMERFLNELLDYSRLRAGETLELMLAPVDLVALTRRLVEDHRRLAPGHRFELLCETGDVIGRWDAARLEHVIENLLSNAVKYSAEGSTVSIEVGHASEGRAMAVLRVRDEGMGIPANDVPRIFEWYARGENVIAITRGTGVGLAGARKIVEQHGGAITVESVEGCGSTFTVCLPLVCREDQQNAERSDPKSTITGA